MRQAVRRVVRLIGSCLLLTVTTLSGAVADAPPDLTRPPAAVTMGDVPIRAIANPPKGDPSVVALGKALFFDKRLSVNNTVSCDSCHDLASNGATANRFDPPLGDEEPVRNTPTVFNAALDFRLNWVGDVRTLQSQADESMRLAMGQPIAVAVSKLSADRQTTALFQRAFGRPPDPAAILDAIAAFEQTLLTPDSAFDVWLKGNADALPQDAQEGYERFKSLGCISCHQGVNIGGNLFQPSGVYSVLSDPARPVMRVPSLRNVATTAPYFHDGSAATLPEAVRIMARAQLDRAVSDTDVRTIVAFLMSLTGQYDGHAVTAPDGQN